MRAPRWLLIAPMLLPAAPQLGAQPYAFVSAAQAPQHGLYVVDLATRTVERRIEGLGDEPAALVASPDRRRVYVASWRALPQAQQEGLVFAIDAEAREVVAGISLGERQTRALALSPDGSVLYAWALSLGEGSDARRLFQLDASTLAPITSLTLPQPGCPPQLHNALRVHPDGRVLTVACSDGLRWFDPATQSLIDAPGDLGGSDILGFSPDGTEVYLSDERTPANAAESRLTALDLDTGAAQRFAFAMPIGQPVPGTASRPRALRYLQRPTDPPGTPTPVVLFGSSGALGFAQILARAAFEDLSLPAAPGTRRLLQSSVVFFSGTAPQGGFDAVDDGSQLVLGGDPALVLETQTWSQAGAGVALPGVVAGVGGDVIIVPWGPSQLFADGFETLP